MRGHARQMCEPAHHGMQQDMTTLVERRYTSWCEMLDTQHNRVLNRRLIAAEHVYIPDQGLQYDMHIVVK